MSDTTKRPETEPAEPQGIVLRYGATDERGLVELRRWASTWRRFPVVVTDLPAGDPSGARWLVEIHLGARWNPDSLRFLFAEHPTPDGRPGVVPAPR